MSQTIQDLEHRVRVLEGTLKYLSADSIFYFQNIIWYFLRINKIRLSIKYLFIF